MTDQKNQSQIAGQAMQFGLMFFASGEIPTDQDKYRLVIESAKFADRQGFSSIWVPERHFTALGCLYPNPAVLQAALARETARIRLQAGSVVLPLHHPLRIAEEWAMVDNLSGGRVGVSFASGWNPSDFAFFPERYANRYEAMYQGIQQVQNLWQGKPVSIERGDGQRQDVRIYPTPIQSDLPIWITAASNPQTFIKAGELGANLLTHLFDQEVEVLAEKIALYRQARLEHGYDPEAGQVTVTLHTFVGDNLAAVQEQVRSPYCEYLKSNINLLKGLGYSRGINISVDTLSPKDLDSVTSLVFEKFFHDRRALLGTPESCSDLVERLRQVGVNEIACLLDFGLDTELILDNLPYLDQLRRACADVAQPVVRSPLDLRQPTALSPKEISPDEVNFEAPIEKIQHRCQQKIVGAEFYQRIQSKGIELGTSFQGIVQLWRGPGEALGKVCLPDSLASDVAGYGVHPALLDACLQVFFATIPTDGDGKLGFHYLPARLGQLQLSGELNDGDLWSHAILRSEAVVGKPTYDGDVRILNKAGQVVMRVTGLRLQQAMVEPQQNVPIQTDWFYGVEWQPRSIAPLVPDYLVSPREIGQHVRQQMTQQDGWAPLEVYHSLFPKLETLSTHYVLWAFKQMEIGLQPGQRLSVKGITQQAQVVDVHQRLLRRSIQILQAAGICRAILSDGTANEWEVCQTVTIDNPETSWRALQAQYPQCAAELDLLGRCGQQLAAVLQGKTDPLQLLFPEGSVTSVERLYQDSPGAQVVNSLVQQSITAALARLPEGRPIRILEIGAGTGGTTTSVLPVLPADCTDYHFTDVSYLFMAKAEDKFQDYPFVQYQVLDIEQDPEAQGFLSSQYDLILAANVLHATADVAQTLTHVKQLLAPGGMLVMLEGTQPQAWVDLIFGLTEGWWKFTDTALRPDSALLSNTQWQTLLQQLEFEPVEVITADTEELSQQTVILATGPTKVEHNIAKDQETPDHWLIFADANDVGCRLAEQLQNQGHRCVLVVPGETYRLVEANRIQINPHQPQDFQRLAQWLRDRDIETWQGVVYFWGLHASSTNMTTIDLETACHWSAQAPLQVLQALDGVECFQNISVWWVTKGAQAVGEQPLAIGQSLLWGLGRTLSVEQPQQWGGLIDLDPQQADTVAQATNVLSVIQSGDGVLADPLDDHLAFRNGQCFSAQLMAQRDRLEEIAAYSWHADSSYLITGGLGDLGLLVADWMAHQGAQHIVLLGRSPLPPRSDWSSVEPGSSAAKRISAIQALEKRGVTVYVVCADVADEAQVAAAIAAAEQQGCPPIKGLFHLAVVPQPLQPLKQLDIATLEQTLRPKVQGSWCLHRLFTNKPLDFFVLFSSWAGLLSEVGQQIGGYSMANTFLDGLAHHRQALGLPAMSINWGDWADIGMRSRYVQQGYKLLPESWTLKPAQGLQSLEQLLTQPMAQMAVLPVPWSEYFKLFPQAANRAFLQPIVQASGQQSQGQANAQSHFLQQLEGLPPDQWLGQLTAYVQAQVASIMGISPPESLDIERGMFEMGMDSLMALELKNSLETSLETAIPAVVAFEHPSVAALSNYLAQDILGWEISNSPDVEPEQDDDDPLAKIAQLSDDEVERLFAEKIAR